MATQRILDFLAKRMKLPTDKIPMTTLGYGRSDAANGKVFPMSDSDVEQKIGTDNLARMERISGANVQKLFRSSGSLHFPGFTAVRRLKDPSVGPGDPACV